MLCLRFYLTILKAYKRFNLNGKLNIQYLVIVKFYVNYKKL